MILELIPVIEVGYNNENVKTPHQYPYWEYPEIWDNYHKECYQYAGFKDMFVPYSKGSSFYKLSDITDSNLAKLTFDHTKPMRDGMYKRPEGTCALPGGFVLRINGYDNFFPQCCGDLSDINFWERIANGKHSYCEGHPTPQIKFEEDNIIFDFSFRDIDETFQPPPKETILVIHKSLIKEAVAKAKKELLLLEQRLNLINKNEGLNITNIGELLIWNNENYK